MADLILQEETREALYYVEPLLDEATLEMIWVEGGSFTMGSPDDEPDRRDNEEPQHEVTVPSFFMGRYPVTQLQWRIVAELPQVKHQLTSDPSNFKGDNRPVEKVSWYDAEEFCLRLSQQTKRDYRLPTEAEWEYACRSGTTTPYFFGKELTTDVANYNSAFNETTDVERFNVANAFGLSDMHGNVDEWCQDHWHESYDDAPTDGSARLTENEESARILRGGSWLHFPEFCRSAVRYYHSPVTRYDALGFRVVCSAPRT